MLYSFLELNREREKKPNRQKMMKEVKKNLPSPGEGRSVGPVLDSVWGSRSHCKGLSL